MRAMQAIGAAHAEGWDAVRCELVVEQQMETYTTDQPRLDPNWTFRDSRGHEHAADGDDLPTLLPWSEEMPCNGLCGGTCGGEGYFETTWWCRLCGERVKPGTIAGPHTFVVPGMKSWHATVHGGAPSRDEFEVQIETEQGWFAGKAVVSGMTFDGRAATTTIIGTGALEEIK